MSLKQIYFYLTQITYLPKKMSLNVRFHVLHNLIFDTFIKISITLWSTQQQNLSPA